MRMLMLPVLALSLITAAVSAAPVKFVKAAYTPKAYFITSTPNTIPFL